MPELNQQEKRSGKKNLFELIMEIIGWLQIVASPLVLGLIAGGFIYFTKPTDTRLVIAIVVAFAGLFIGIIWATRIWRRKGTMNFLSRAMATTELDEVDDDGIKK